MTPLWLKISLMGYIYLDLPWACKKMQLPSHGHLTVHVNSYILKWDFSSLAKRQWYRPKAFPFVTFPLSSRFKHQMREYFDAGKLQVEESSITKQGQGFSSLTWKLCIRGLHIHISIKSYGKLHFPANQRAWKKQEERRIMWHGISRT